MVFGMETRGAGELVCRVHLSEKIVDLDKHSGELNDSEKRILIGKQQMADLLFESNGKKDGFSIDSERQGEELEHLKEERDALQKGQVALILENEENKRLFLLQAQCMQNEWQSLLKEKAQLEEENRKLLFDNKLGKNGNEALGQAMTMLKNNKDWKISRVKSEIRSWMFAAAAVTSCAWFMVVVILMSHDDAFRVAIENKVASIFSYGASFVAS
jgi:hypothetical protein